MRYVCNYTWRVFYSCFIQGAWRCLNQDMDFERHATFSFSSDAGVLDKKLSDFRNMMFCLINAA